MELDKIKKIETSVEKLGNKSARIYFLVQDTKGNPKAGIAYIYQMAMSLRNKGFNVKMIHETKDYQGVEEWLGKEYMEIEHLPIEGQNLPISPEDFVVIPELYAHVMEQLKNYPCGKLVLCQAYDYMLETLPPGISWANYGFIKFITTSEFQKEYIRSVFKNVSVDIVEPVVSEIFTKKEKPSKPIVSIHCREPRDTAKIIKSFYMKYPQYRWFTFRDMKNISQTDFSKFLKESFVSVWIDRESGFGTFPIESMISNTPVIGVVPNLKPDWMNENNGVWTYSFNEVIDILANFAQNWLEDNISEDLYTNMTETGKKFQNKPLFDEKVETLFNEYFQVRKEMFNQQLEKLKITEEN